jgi:hypothetical protein
MIQLDPRKRPRVEDLEILSSLQPAMNAAKAIANDYKTQQVSFPKFTANAFAYQSLLLHNSPMEPKCVN